MDLCLVYICAKLMTHFLSQGCVQLVRTGVVPFSKCKHGRLCRLQTSSASSIVDAVQPSETKKPQNNQMSSIPKSLAEAKRSTPLVNGGATAAGASGGGSSSSLASRIPTASTAPGMVVGVGVAASLGRKSRVAAVAQQKTLLTGRLGVTSPPTQRPIDSHYGSVRRTEMTKVIGQATAATATTAGAQGHQGNQTYTLIAYQPTQSGALIPLAYTCSSRFTWIGFSYP